MTAPAADKRVGINRDIDSIIKDLKKEYDEQNRLFNARMESGDPATDTATPLRRMLIVGQFIQDVTKERIIEIDNSEKMRNLIATLERLKGDVKRYKDELNQTQQTIQAATLIIGGLANLVTKLAAFA